MNEAVPSGTASRWICLPVIVVWQVAGSQFSKR
jgi:hypothetical protein